jgi:hypothetical protein
LLIFLCVFPFHIFILSLSRKFHGEESKPASNIQQWKNFRLHDLYLLFFGERAIGAPSARRWLGFDSGGEWINDYVNSPENVEKLVSAVSKPSFTDKCQILVWKLLTRSTRFTDFCTALTSNFQQKGHPIFQNEYSFFKMSRFLDVFPKQSLPCLNSILV